MVNTKIKGLCLLELLREYSDADNIMPMREIISKMKSMYGLEVDRRFVYDYCEKLTNMGYDISMYSENGKGYYLRTRDFEPSEVRALIDCVYSNPSLPHSQTNELIEKLQKLLPKGKRKSYNNLLSVQTKRKLSDNTVFFNIELIDEAIAAKKQIEFTYMKYDINKRLVPKRGEKYVVSPFAMAVANDVYYLLGASEDRDGVSQYRIDKIADIIITDENVKTVPDDFNVAKYADENVFMYGGKQVEASFKCDIAMLGHVIDKFGQRAKLKADGDNEFTFTVTGSFEGLKIWAAHYIDACEVTAPQELRRAVVDMIKRNRYGV